MNVVLTQIWVHENPTPPATSQHFLRHILQFVGRGLLGHIFHLHTNVIPVSSIPYLFKTFKGRRSHSVGVEFHDLDDAEDTLAAFHAPLTGGLHRLHPVVL